MKSFDVLSILLFSSSDYLPLYVARSLPAGKYTIFFLGPAGQAVRFSRFCKKYFTSEHTDAALIWQINTISKQYTIAAIIPLDLSATVCTARIQSGLTCLVSPVSSVDDIMLLANKWEFIPLLRTLDIRHPKTLLVRTPLELHDGILPKPFLVKPLMQDSGKGIQKITSCRDVEQYKKSFSQYKTFPLIVQEYIEGRDVDLSIVAKEGVIHGWTIQRWREGGELEFFDDPEVLSIGQHLVRYIRFNGFMHIDMRRDTQTGKLYVLECNPRTWGSIGASIGAGVDFIELAVRCAQNRRIPHVREPDTTYMAPVRLLIRGLKNPRFFNQASYASEHDFVGMFSDPLPYIVLFVKQCIKHILLGFTFTRWYRKRLIDMERKAYLSHITN